MHLVSTAHILVLLLVAGDVLLPHRFNGLSLLALVDLEFILASSIGLVVSPGFRLVRAEYLTNSVLAMNGGDANVHHGQTLGLPMCLPVSLIGVMIELGRAWRPVGEAGIPSRWQLDPLQRLGGQA